MRRNKRYVAILWDIDGTLIDSEPLHDLAVFCALKEMGTTIGRDSLDMLGTTWEDTWKIVGGAVDSFPQFEKRVTDFYLKKLSTLTQRSTAVDFIKTFNKQGIIQGAVSNSKQVIVAANLRHLSLDEVLSVVISRDDCVRGKPHPDPYIEAARKLGVRTQECIAVEDAPRGAQAAKTAGCLTIFWPQDFNLSSDHADIKVQELEDFNWDENLGTQTPKHLLKRRLFP